MPHPTEVPDLERVTDRVFRIPLPLPLPDLPIVNCYAVRGDTGVVLIDPGWSTPESEAALRAGLRTLDVEPGDVTKMLVTHAHWDHVGQAAVWQRELGIPLHMGREEHHGIDTFAAGRKGYGPQIEQVGRAGAPELGAAVAALPWEPYEEGIKVTGADVWLDDLDVIDCGGHTLIAHHTPGHTRGHIVFEDPHDDLMFTGDHVLPRITPSVAFENDPEELPLRSYLASLRLLLDRPDARMLPAHGAVTDSVHERAAELLEHHRERLDVILGLVNEGFTSGADVARQMRWTRRERTIDELGPIHSMNAVNEVVAHLDLLAHRGDLERDESGSIIRFQPATS